MDIPHNLGIFPDTLVGTIYESLDKENPWIDSLESLRMALDSNVACLRISQKGSNPREHLFAAGPRACPESVAEWEAWSARDLRPVDVKLGEVRIVNWADIAPTGAMSEILDRYEVQSMIVMCIDMTDGAEYTLTCCRDSDAGAYTVEEIGFLKMIGAHFRRAMRLRRDIARSKVVNEFQAEALDRLAIAAVMIDNGNEPVLLNKTAQDIVASKDGVRISNGRIHAINDRDDRELQAALRTVQSSGAEDISRAMLIKRDGGGRDMGIVVSSRASVSLISNKPERCVLIFLRNAEVVSNDDVTLLRQLFSFTKAEANLAVGLAKGLRLEDVESELNIRHNTARAHLRSMFLKADVTRQSELVHVLMNSVVPLGRGTNVQSLNS